MIVAAVFMLIIGAVAHIGHRSYNKLQKEAQIYSDLGHGLKLVRNRVRNSSTNLSIVNAPDGDPRWVGTNVLLVDGGGFGLFQETGSSRVDFVFVPDINNVNHRDAIFSIDTADNDQNTIEFTRVNNTITIQKIQGIKGEIPFSMPDVSILRRAS